MKRFTWLNLPFFNVPDAGAGGAPAAPATPAAATPPADGGSPPAPSAGAPAPGAADPTGAGAFYRPEGLPDHLIGQGVTLMNFFSIGGLGLAQALTGALATRLRPVVEPPVVYGALFWAYAAALSGATLIYAFAPRHPAPKPQEPAS